MVGRVVLLVVGAVMWVKLSAGTRPQPDARLGKPAVQAATTLTRRGIIAQIGRLPTLAA